VPVDIFRRNIQEMPISAVLRIVVKQCSDCYACFRSSLLSPKRWLSPQTLSYLLSEIGLPGTEDEYRKLFPNSGQLTGKLYLEPQLEHLFEVLGEVLAFFYKISESAHLGPPGIQKVCLGYPREDASNLFSGNWSGARI
jgi:hypothetical protein